MKKISFVSESKDEKTIQQTTTLTSTAAHGSYPFREILMKSDRWSFVDNFMIQRQVSPFVNDDNETLPNRRIRESLEFENPSNSGICARIQLAVFFLTT